MYKNFLNDTTGWFYQQRPLPKLTCAHFLKKFLQGRMDYVEENLQGIHYTDRACRSEESDQFR